MSEVRALLLTDVVDSTKLAEEIGDAAMAGVWASHDRAARDLLQRHRGREIDKTDGMLMLFEGVADAVAFVLDYHRALAELPVPLSARAGLHVGPVILRENRADDVARGAKPLEVEGLAKPATARVMAIARGGQTLLTAEARLALGATDYRIESHGYWIVKGIADPVELFELGEGDGRFIAPADGDKAYRVVRAAEWWLPVRDIPHNLPHQSTSFVGRDAELRVVKSLLEKTRLVTLLGMGGLGKTRLALEAAAEELHRFPDGVWFIDLSPLREESLVAGEAAQVLGVKSEPDRTALQSVCGHLKDKRALLVIDNCEHLVGASAEMANALLRAAPHVRLIATSREALRVPGEQALPVLPLPLPGRDASLQEVSRSAAVQLFIQRAQQNRPSFVLDEAQAEGVAELVARLEGIPLALELAAARVRSLSVADINARLNDRYKLLTGGARVLQQRQQTLRALVDWSYDLLDAREQCLLSRLGVFIGGFDLAAAESVCGVDPLDPADVLDLLASLVEKSLVAADESGDTVRYGMLETIREYAAGRLDASGGREQTARRHCEWCFALAKQARDGLEGGGEQGAWLRRLEAELDNMRSAIALSLSGAVDPLIAVKMCAALHSFWLLRGYATEARGILGAALERPEVRESKVAHAWALYLGAGLAESQSDHAEARRMLESCLGLRRELGNPIDIAATLSTLSLARLQGGDVQGAEASELEALKIFRDAGSRLGEAVALCHLGPIHHRAGNDAEAEACLEQGLRLAREIGNKEIEGECLLVTGQIAFESGRFEAAEQCFRRSLDVCREAADKRGEANATRWLGKCDLRRGESGAAGARLGEALHAYRSFEMWEELLGCLEDLAALLAKSDGPKAAQLMAAAGAARDRMQLPRAPKDEEQWRERTLGLSAHLGEHEFHAQCATGKALEISEAIAEARAAAGTPVLA